MSRLTSAGVTSLLTYYRNTYVRAKAIGTVDEPGGGGYETAFQNITWSSVSTGIVNGRPTANMDLSVPLEWVDIPADRTMTQINIYTASGTDPIAIYFLDSPRIFSTTGTLRITSLPTVLNSILGS